MDNKMTTNILTPSKWPENISILIPAYNAAAELDRFLELLLSAVPEEYICIVDDASTDLTASICMKYQIHYLKHERNRGKGAALKKGFNYLINKRVNTEWIITMDADGQHSISDIPFFIEAINKNAGSGIIIGNREKSPGKMPLARIFSNRITSGFLSLLCKTIIFDSQCGYRAYSTEFLKKISIRYNRFEMESEVIIKAIAAGYNVDFIKIQTLYCSSHSHISHFIDILRWIRAVFSVWYEVRKKLKFAASQAVCR